MNSELATEISSIFSRFAVLLLVYAFTSTTYPEYKSIVQVLFALGMTSTIYQSRRFQTWFVNKLFKKPESQRAGIASAVLALQSYGSRASNWNAMCNKRYKTMPLEHQSQAKKLGYLDHISKVEKTLMTNAKLAEDIAGEAAYEHDVSPLEMRSVTPSQQSRVIESLTHFARDWSDQHDNEIQPILSYIKKHSKEINKERTLVIVPGSGLGRVAHEVANMGFKHVHAVEFSSLMHLCNQFVYKQRKDYTIAPYVHSYSHSTGVQNQVRSVPIHRVERPENLSLHLADFRTFVPETDPSQYDHVLIVSVYFIDTAENIFEYFDAVERLVGKKKGTWINQGPIKYGSAPKVQLSHDELTQLRKIRGWKDKNVEVGEMNGYLTDEKGLWKGYYGLSKFVATI